MTKNYLLTGILIGFVCIGLNVSLHAGNNIPENPYEQQYVVSSLNKAFQILPSRTFEKFTQVPLDTIPLKDRKGDFINDKNKNPFDLKDPSPVVKSVEYDPVSGNYIITEKIGEEYFRPPTYMTFDEYMKYKAKQQESEYFNSLSGISGTRSSSGRLDPVAKIDVKNQLIERLFGGTEVDIRPQGNIDLTFGVEFSNIQNPSFTQRQQRQGGFDFDMGIQMNVQGSIGEKLKLSTNYNTQATFDFDNTMKLDYGSSDLFGEDDIIKKIEAGNVSLPFRGTLIQGSQSLFGLKTEMQFGKLRLTAVASQQKSEREEITLQGGSQFQEFIVNADEYDENRHFFLTHYNRNNYEEILAELPDLRTLFTIQNLQVWVTDTRNATENIRDIIAIADLGEPRRVTNTTPGMQPPLVPKFRDLQGEGLPDNNANPIYGQLASDQRLRIVDRAVNALKSPPFNMQQGRDFEKVSARKLSPTEYTFHPNLGFISLNVNIQPDQVVGIAFEYSYKDSIFQVGEIAEDVPQNTDTTTQNVLFVKMLKGTTQRVDLPTWDLMMKNIYSIGAFNVAREDFRLDIYYEDPGQGKKRFLPETNLAGVPLLRVFNLDRLNVQNDPQPDGVFDYVEGITINTRNGRIIFPVLEPFGSALGKKFSNPADSARFVYSQLYNSTLTNAREFAEFNRFTIEGSYKSSVSSEISLGAFNIPPGSIVVSAGGQHLREGIDYEVDYNIGRIKILNDAILNAGAPIRVSYEDNTLFGFQTKTMVGLRADYEVNKNLTIGGTYLHLFERPFTQKVNIGDDPINNRIFGLDVNYGKDAPWLTKMLDKLPFYSTKEISRITITAETAALRPGHARAINEESADGDKGGVNYLDDFEGSVSSLDLRTPYIGTNGWVISSIPQNDEHNNNPLFPEAVFKDTTLTGVNRALLSWYRIDPSLRNAASNQGNPYTLAIRQQEIFPNFTPTQQFGDTYAQILDVMYDPRKRGPYNFDVPGGTSHSRGIDFNADLVDPKSRWAGIMRSLNTNDFEAANIEFIEFWMMSPYLDTLGTGSSNPDALGGGMDGFIYFNLGNVSEDILPDSRKFFENGLPGPNTQGRRATNTGWGRVPLTQQITNAFDINTENRRAQDVGLEGLNDADERQKFSGFLSAVQSTVSPNILEAIKADPSNDNFKHYRDFSDETPILTRYSRYYGTEGNTPENTGGNFVMSSTQLPDSEDLDGDRTLNETESYFQYRVPIQFDGNRGIRTDNNPFITESITSTDGKRIWYRFRIPLNLLETDENFKRVGGIRDFRSIRFARIYFKGFEKRMNFRFGTLELVRNQWRRYKQDLGEACFAIEPPDFNDRTSFEVNAVNIEENSSRKPFNYVLPPGISREQALGVNLHALQNEQSLSLGVCDLEDGDARAIYKTANIDMRVFSKLKMFVHAEPNVCSMGPVPVKDGDLTVFIRLGSDFKNNFYEYEIPLKISTDVTTPFNDPAYLRIVWPTENDFNIDFELLKQIKINRNASGIAIGDIYFEADPNRPDARFSIKGNPNLGLVKAIMIGVRNPIKGNDCDPSDKKSVEIWVNELRAFGLDERGGVAGTARVDFQLADLGNLTLSSKFSSIGFGALDQQLAQRSKEQITQYDIATNLELSKFLPQGTGLRIPFYFQYSKEIRNPQYDPYDLDLELKEKVDSYDSREERDSIREQAQYITSIKSYNFTNVRKERTNSQKKPMPWDIANFSFTYAFDETEHRNPIIESDVLTRRRGAIDYTYSKPVRYLEPFRDMIKNDKYLRLIKEINFNPIPNSFSFSTDLDRRFNTTKYRFAGENPLYNTYFNKQFLWSRDYDLQWDITKNIKFIFSADNRSIIDEPSEVGMLERSRLSSSDPLYISDIGQYRRDSIWSSISDFGRTKNYAHNFSLTYNLPLRFLPFMDWVTVRANYKADYGWDAASQTPLGRSLGNIIRNGQSRQLTGDFDFEKMYNYSNYLRKINTRQRPSSARPSQRNRPDVQTQTNAATRSRAEEPQREPGEPSQVERAVIRPLMALRKIRLTYSEDFSTVVPGYMQGVDVLGMSGFNAPGWGFIAGLQPNLNQDDYYTSKDWLYSNWNWITGDQLLNSPVTQNYQEQMDAKITIEPFTDFRVDVEANRVKSKNHSEFFRRDDLLNPADPDSRFQTEFEHLIPRDFGSLTLTYSALNTLFNDDLSGLFKNFEKNRVILANRMGSAPGGTHDNAEDAQRGFPKGYGRYHQNVLVPSFLAAYTDQDANTMDISSNYINDIVLKLLPRPNWRLTYNGLSRVAPFSAVFQSFSLNHGYRGSLTVNSFQTNLQYDRNAPEKLDQTKLDFFTRFEVPNIQIQEQFNPLIGVDMRLKNDMSFKVEYKTNRTLNMGFVDNRLHETKGEDFTVGFGYRLKDVKFAFLSTGNRNRDNTSNQQRPSQQGGVLRGGQGQAGDLDITFDFSVRDDITTIYELDTDLEEPSRGNRTVSILPQATYQLNRQLSLRFFFDYRRNIPKTSQGYPTTNIRSGVTVRFSLN